MAGQADHGVLAKILGSTVNKLVGADQRALNVGALLLHKGLCRIQGAPGTAAAHIVQGLYAADVLFCFQDFGNEISSDFARDKYVSRETSKKQISKKLSEIEKTGLPVMINGGSAYALPYADIVADMNLAGSDYSIFDEEIPFVQLAFHGYVNYTGEALNLTQNKSDELLKSVEYGAGLMFNVMNETAFALQKTRYTDYFGSEYASAKPQIFETYTRYNKELGHIFNQEMVNHELLTDTLTCTTYADGTKVYVNFDYLDGTTPDGTMVPARDYKVIR